MQNLPKVTIWSQFKPRGGHNGIQLTPMLDQEFTEKEGNIGEKGVFFNLLHHVHRKCGPRYGGGGGVQVDQNPRYGIFYCILLIFY